MEIVTLPCGPIQANAYIVWAKGSSSCAVIDPGEAGLILDELSRRQLTCTHILLTHGHFDHMWGAADLRQATNAKIYVHPKDAPMLEGRGQVMNAMSRGMKPCKADVLVADGDIIEAGGVRFAVLETPGHTPGGVSYAVHEEKTVFTGDTLFFESVGRTDLGGDLRTLLHSLFDKLYALDGYAVYPGHEEPTTIHHEQEFNPMNIYRKHPWFN